MTESKPFKPFYEMYVCTQQKLFLFVKKKYVGN